MWRYLMPIGIFVVLAGFFLRGLSLNPRYVPSPLLGKPAPEFELPRLKDPGASLGSEDLEGKVALLNVWATWCVGCRQEHGKTIGVRRWVGCPHWEILMWLRRSMSWVRSPSIGAFTVRLKHSSSRATEQSFTNTSRL